jgi:hypothetical protein
MSSQNAAQKWRSRTLYNHSEPKVTRCGTGRAHAQHVFDSDANSCKVGDRSQSRGLFLVIESDYGAHGLRFSPTLLCRGETLL